jgi:hypothetical protein
MRCARAIVARHEPPAPNSLLEMDPARFIPARGLRAYLGLLAAQFRNFRRQRSLRRGICPDCGAPLEPTSLRPELVVDSCPHRHAFTAHRSRDPN